MKRDPHRLPEDVPLPFEDAAPPRGDRMTKPRKRTGAYAQLDAAGDPAAQPATIAPDLDPVARAAVESQPRRKGSKRDTYGRLARGHRQVNVSLPPDLVLRLKRHCEDATVRAQAADELAPAVTMSAVIEALVRQYLEGLKG